MVENRLDRSSQGVSLRFCSLVEWEVYSGKQPPVQAAGQAHATSRLISALLASGCSSLAKMRHEACFAQMWPTTGAQLEVPIAQQWDVSGHAEMVDLIVAAGVDLSLAPGAEIEHTDMEIARRAGKHILVERYRRLVGPDAQDLEARLVEGSDASVLLGILEAVDTGMRRTWVDAGAQEGAVKLHPMDLE